MLDDIEGQPNKLTSDEAFHLMQELERNTTEEIRRQRAHFRLAVKVGVILQAGNASEVLTFKVKEFRGTSLKAGAVCCSRYHRGSAIYTASNSTPRRLISR